MTLEVLPVTLEVLMYHCEFDFSNLMQLLKEETYESYDTTEI